LPLSKIRRGNQAFFERKKRNPSASPIVTLVTCVHSVQQCNGSYMKKISALQEKSPPVEKKIEERKKNRQITAR